MFILINVQKYHLEDAVKVTVAGAQVNLITDYGLITKDAATAFFDDAPKAMIAGVDARGAPVALAGADDAAQLLQARLIQNIKILFFKLSKSLAPMYEKTLLIKLKGMYILLDGRVVVLKFWIQVFASHFISSYFLGRATPVCCGSGGPALGVTWSRHVSFPV